MTMTQLDTGSSPGWDAVIGQSAAVTALQRAVAADEISHAWMMVGPRGVGQQELARALGMALNCEAADATHAACGTCSTCDRIQRGVHPAVVDLEPEGAFHVVDAVRNDWIPTASRTMTDGRRRVLRIVAADRMNETAQNAFLKVLEEPPPSVVWLLDVQDEGLLLDTVVSRCRRLTVVPWGPDALQTLAGQLDLPTSQRDALTRAALGSPERLRAFADPTLIDARARNLQLVGRLADEGPGAVVPISKDLIAWTRQRVAAVKEVNEAEMARLEDSFGIDGGRGWQTGVKARLTRRFERLERQERRRALDFVLDDLGSWLRDLLVVQSGGEMSMLVNIDAADAARKDAARLSSAATVECLQAVAACRDALDRNGNPELQLERMLLAIALHLFRHASCAQTR